MINTIIILDLHWQYTNETFTTDRVQKSFKVMQGLNAQRLAISVDWLYHLCR